MKKTKPKGSKPPSLLLTKEGTLQLKSPNGAILMTSPEFPSWISIGAVIELILARDCLIRITNLNRVIVTSSVIILLRSKKYSTRSIATQTRDRLLTLLQQVETYDLESSIK